MGWLEHTVIPDINWQRDRHWSRWGNIRVASDDVRFGSKADMQSRAQPDNDPHGAMQKRA
jgi:hypothetical protein